VTWVGKIIGGIVGALIAGRWGFLIGVILGHQFDRGAGPVAFTRGTGGGAQSQRLRRQLFFETTFLALGHLAKADGRVSEGDIAAARLVMQDMRLPEADTRRAMELFSEGKQPDFPLISRVAAFRDTCRGQPEILRAFLELVLEYALHDGGISPAERAVLARVAETLGFGQLDMVHLESVLRARRAFRQQRGAGATGGPTGTLAGAYEALGVTPAATDGEIKTAYRRLMNQHHPDKLSAKGLPDSLLEVAKERTQEIQAAYELIRQQRGLR
jgi:DnaJ like chaperone protein